jgi:hypothetical protein
MLLATDVVCARGVLLTVSRGWRLHLRSIPSQHIVFRLYALLPARTYNVDTAIPRNSNDAVEGAQIYAYYRHVYRRWRGIWAL